MYVCVCMCLFLHVCISMWIVFKCIACIGPLEHENHNSVPKTPSPDPATEGTHSGHPRACAHPLFDPSPIPPPRPEFFYLFLKNLCLDLSCHGHRISQDPPDTFGQAKTFQSFPNCPPTSIVQDTIARAESRYLFVAWGCIKDAPLQQYFVLVRLSTAVESARIVQAGSNLAESPFHAQCTSTGPGCIDVCWSCRVIFTVLVYQRWPSCLMFNM
jgi:hypothetical protein